MNKSVKKMCKGFTLIEMLVVVIIIGILAAIALPQYKKVVTKTRFAEVVTNLHKLMDAQQRYYLINGTYTNNRDNLDIDFPLAKHDSKYIIQISKDVSCGLEGAPQNVYCGSRNIKLTLIYLFGRYYYCVNYDLSNQYNDELCKKFLNTNSLYTSSPDSRTYAGRRHNL